MVSGWLDETLHTPERNLNELQAIPDGENVTDQLVDEFLRLPCTGADEDAIAVAYELAQWTAAHLALTAP
jgi:hypothetical protein